VHGLQNNSRAPPTFKQHSHSDKSTDLSCSKSNLPARHAPEEAGGLTGKMLCCISCANCQTSEPRAQSTRHGGANSFLLPRFYDCLRSTANESTLFSKVKMLRRICQLSTRSRGKHYPCILNGAAFVDCVGLVLWFRGKRSWLFRETSVSGATLARHASRQHCDRR